MTWERMIKEEPELAAFFADLERVSVGSSPASKSARWFAFQKLHGTTPKLYLMKLVGWDARNPKLRSQKAYAMAMDRMWELVQ